MSDQELAWIQQARAGDHAAFSRLVEAYQTPVYNLAYRMLGNPAEAEDAAQETFLRAYAQLHTYRPEYKFSTWILSIASHYCVDRLRRRRFIWLSTDAEPIQQILHARAAGEEPEAIALEAETRAEIQTVLDRLDPMYREPIILRYWHDLSYKEIAEVMGITEAAVKTRLHRARLQLAASMATDSRMCDGLNQASTTRIATDIES
ncbi:MAG: sigma-70 family RNA polymerase sigma factor [Anaerolineae bacterium]|nr:sigma-70 family RNA polymerase sigma factor [Anaerolineae bacterium]MDW8100276.1 sigma-70 family RNA polymerase sigma factor [Anaerolineae bacterium]